MSRSRADAASGPERLDHETSSTAGCPGTDDGGVTGDGGAEGTADVINGGVLDSAARRVTLVAVTDANWRDIADVAPRDDQRGFVPPSAARYLLLSQREGEWHSLGVHADDIIVGHVMWGWDDDDQMHWIGGVMVDAGEQGKGVGRAAMVTLIRWLFAKPNVTAVRLSYQPENVAARAMYVDLGFVESDVPVDDEIMAELTAARAVPLL
ncbi:GNAT family N-acetyltransferase [Knoellia sp. S7-12]|uniref:GNAT family N-acetyltransferase n=1 Tax=Knoellia sp. S7-12 TaxID=3126698 RepID=UPI003369344D